MKNPLVTSLEQHIKKKRISFHTPGHKGRISDRIVTRFDLTEIEGLDSLFEANSVILDAEKNAAVVFGADKTLFSAGGCTLCIQAMLKLAANENDKVIFARGSHRTAINAAALLGIDPLWLYPEKDAGEGYPGRYTAQSVEKAIKQNPKAKAVYITSPDYYGCISPVNEIGEVCRKYGIPLLVDRAHGSHLPFLPQTKTAVSGADMYADSAHKTLPVLTGGAFLNIYNNVYSGNSKQAMSLFGSTSPSYPIMASMDLAVTWIDEVGKGELARTAKEVSEIKQTAENKGIGIPIGHCDPCRVTIRTADIGYTGENAAIYFRANGIEPEYYDTSSIVFICTPMNTPQELDTLNNAIRNMPILSKIKIYEYPLPKTEKKLSPRKAIFASNEKIDIEKSVGRIAAQTVCPCPPGIPIVMPGEIITKEIAIFLHKYGNLTIDVVK